MNAKNNFAVNASSQFIKDFATLKKSDFLKAIFTIDNAKNAKWSSKKIKDATI